MFRSKADKERIEELEATVSRLQSRISEKENGMIVAQSRMITEAERTIVANHKTIQELREKIERQKQGVRDVIDPKPAVDPVWCSCPHTKPKDIGFRCVVCGRVIHQAASPVPRVPECACRTAETAAALRATRDALASLSRDIAAINGQEFWTGCCAGCTRLVTKWRTGGMGNPVHYSCQWCGSAN